MRIFVFLLCFMFVFSISAAEYQYSEVTKSGFTHKYNLHKLNSLLRSTSNSSYTLVQSGTFSMYFNGELANYNYPFHIDISSSGNYLLRVIFNFDSKWQSNWKIALFGGDWFIKPYYVYPFMLFNGSSYSSDNPSVSVRCSPDKSSYCIDFYFHFDSSFEYIDVQSYMGVSGNYTLYSLGDLPLGTSGETSFTVGSDGVIPPPSSGGGGEDPPGGGEDPPGGGEDPPGGGEDPPGGGEDPPGGGEDPPGGGEDPPDGEFTVPPFPDIKKQDVLQDLPGKFEFEVDPVIGNPVFPVFSVPLPSGVSVDLNLSPDVSPVGNFFYACARFIRGLCAFFISIVFYFRMLKLFRKNS